MTIAVDRAPIVFPRRYLRLGRGLLDGSTWIIAVALFMAGTHWAPQLAASAAAIVAVAAVAYLRAHRLQAMFSQYVGADVARRAVRSGTELGGQEVEIGVLFVDLVGYTAFVAARSPDDVVRLLNQFFRIVVDTVERHGGYVNKFEGDAVLAVFGAPRAIGDSHGAALIAARDLHGAFAEQLGTHGYGIGVSAGRAFAGHVGARSRLEYTVIGDPVNEAARLTELAKTEPGRVLASATAINGAAAAEVSEWNLGEAVLLRGRRAQTVLARPVAS